MSNHTDEMSAHGTFQFFGHALLVVLDLTFDKLDLDQFMPFKGL